MAVSVGAVVAAADLTAAEAVVVAVGADSEVPGAVTVAGEAVDLPHTEQVLPKVDAKLPSSQVCPSSVSFLHFSPFSGEFFDFFRLQIFLSYRIF